MAKGPPKIFAIDHDEYHAEFCGKTRDGTQFFLTTPFVPKTSGKPGREFVALYTFDKKGVLIKADIVDFGTRAKLNHAARVAKRDALLAKLGPVRYQRIKVAPFKLKRFGVEFGFIPQPPEDDGEWSVIFEPGNFMCFWPPWTSGIYDT